MWNIAIVLLAIGVQWTGSLYAQDKSDWKACPVIATFPIKHDTGNDVSAQPRFELRLCHGESMVVNCFERNKATPSVSFETGYPYPPYLVHASNILAFQSVGGASDHVYVFFFRNGKATEPIRTATKDSMEVVRSEHTLKVIVPPTTYPGSDGKWPPRPPPKLYSFELQ
jgi:hypothetical protein